MQNFNTDQWIWVPDETEMYLPFKVLEKFNRGQKVKIISEDGEIVKLDESKSMGVLECNIEALNSRIDDLVNISDLNEMSILHNLRIRYKQDLIYTKISSILISVNPFKLLPLYTAEVLDRYRTGTRDLPPHIYGVAYDAYNGMMLSSRGDQSVVISGESGAGKSEATKLILQFLADLSTKASLVNMAFTSTSSTSLEQQILAANPILEAFGNAKTLRNNNSSRFGKLITVNFDKNGAIIGGGIINYLLEKSRVVFQNQGERNYHIFYQLLSASITDTNLTHELKLQSANLFAFTSQSGVTAVDGMSDEKDFEDLRNSMSILKFSSDDLNELFRIVAGVLHFGNLKVKTINNNTSDDASVISNTEVLQHACKLWGIDNYSLMEKFLCSKNIGTKEIVLVAYNAQQAVDARDAMVKKVYAELFQIVVDKINVTLSSGNNSKHSFIGVLDIFGFESFDVNSFEQLCINYCNEKLQFHFNEHIFKMEQNLYELEGIKIDGTSFVDNQPTLDLLELKNIGVFAVCDEEINVPRGSDDGFLQKILLKYSDGKHPNMCRPKAKECKDFHKNFGIAHYAGTVFYNVTGFLEKNKDQLHIDIINVLRESSSPWISRMFPHVEDTKGKGGSNIKRSSLSFQFKSQLNDLITTINATHPHFVRCMKPNDEKLGNRFNSSRMLDQLRYAGLVEVCRIRKLGYPVRRSFDEFFMRYKCCDLLSNNLDSLLASLISKGVLKTEWAKGHSRIFMRTEQSYLLENAREQAFVKVVVSVQRVARVYIHRERLKHYKKILLSINDAILSRNITDLNRVIDLGFELPYNGSHLPCIQEAKSVVLRLLEESRLLTLLISAIESNEISALKNSITETTKLKPPYTPIELSIAKQNLQRLEQELECLNGLIDAISSRLLDHLLKYINIAESLQYTCDELNQAKVLKLRIEEENATLLSLLQAIGERNLQNINTILSKCFALNITDRGEISDAKIVVEELLTQQAEAERLAEEERQRREKELAENRRNEIIQDIKTRLLHGIASNNRSLLSEGLQEALQYNVDSHEIQCAKVHLSLLHQVHDASGQIAASIKMLQFKLVSNNDNLDTTDTEPLTEVLDKAKSMNCPLLDECINQAEKLLLSYNQMIKVSTQLKNSLVQDDRLEFKQALEAADNLNLSNNLVSKVREKLKEKEEAYRDDKGKGIIVEELQPFDAAEEARLVRREIASQPRFDFKNYPNLCSSDDYAKGIILNKSKFKDCFLSFQSSVIPRSLVELTKDFNKLAVQLHKNLLGYMGDKQMHFPAMLAQEILRKGFTYKNIRDEIYLQIIKQLTNNPRSESIARGWQMLCMCVGTFPPSYEFENFLLHYILEKISTGKGAVVDYAKYCLRTLEAILNTGDGSGFVPSVEEILAFKERPPILATIYLVDGSVIAQDLPVTPDLNVGKILEMCAGWLDLHDSRANTFGIFVYDMGEMDPKNKSQPYDLPITPRPLRNDEFLGDVVVQRARQRRQYKLVVKKKIFLLKHNYRGNDPYYERLVYLQAEDDAIIQDTLQFDDDSVVCKLTVLSLIIAFGDSINYDTQGLLNCGVLDFIVPSWRKKRTANEWCALILNLDINNMLSIDVAELQQMFVEIVQENPFYGNHWFYVYKSNEGQNLPGYMQELPSNLILAFNENGMFIHDIKYNLLVTFSYAAINRWGGTTDQFSMLLNVEEDLEGESFEFVVYTTQGTDIGAILIDNIHILMNELSNEDNE